MQDRSCLSRAACLVHPYMASIHCSMEISLDKFKDQKETDRKQKYKQALMGRKENGCDFTLGCVMA